MSHHRFLPAVRLTMSISVLCLIASTWPLWTGSSSFPQVPFFESLCGIGPWADTLSLALVLTGAVSTLFGAAASLRSPVDWKAESFERKAHRLEMAGPWILAVGLCFAMLLNQHRLQPWAWHFLLITPLLARKASWLEQVVPRRFDLYGILGFTISLYLFSAISKCDQTFTQSYGRQFLEALLNIVGASSRFWSESARTNGAALFPLGEIVVAFLIVLPKTRLAGLLLSVVMHVFLLLAVGPFGLNHQPGVLIWNVYFIAQNLLLWGRIRALSPEDLTERFRLPTDSGSNQLTMTSRLGLIPSVVASMILLVAILLPPLRFAGLCDPWPAWAVYASQPERVTILINEPAASELPDELRRFLRPRRLNDGRVFFRADLWSIAETGAPIYPGARFPVAIARALNARPELRGKVDLVLESPAEWWIGERDSDEYAGQSGIDAASKLFRLNTKTRQQ
ncbi:MAG: hypothetical protein O2820_09950 [Planctomycetota bacterium]|nr:hypothetical protein [Planctomycetota bacterium]MDA1249535.1 hypothetical protein [Planctomycetota bacterium]